MTFQLGHTRFTFVTSHLNAHMEEMGRRNQAYQRIAGDLHVAQPDEPEDEAEEEAALVRGGVGLERGRGVPLTWLMVSIVVSLRQSASAGR